MVRRITITGLIVYCMVTSSAFAGTWKDDFEDGDFDGWEVFNPGPGEIWDVENGELSGQYATGNGTYSVVQLEVENAALWEDYSVVCKAKLVENFANGWFGIFFRVTGGSGHGFYVNVGKKKVLGRTAAWVKLSDVPLPFDVLEDTWYELKMIAEGDHFEFYINNELTGAFDDGSRPSGTVWLIVRNAHVHFDDVVITGPEIPDGGPGFVETPQPDFAVTPQSKIVTMWGSVKRGR